MALLAVACGSASPEPAAAPAPDSNVIVLSAEGVGDIEFGDDFDVALEYVSERLGPPRDVRREDGGGCGAFGGCELLATWDGFAIAGPYGTSTMAFWAVETAPQFDDVFALAGAPSISSARDQASWPVDIDAFVSPDDGTWTLTFGDLGLYGQSLHEVPPPASPNDSPEFPAEAEVDFVFYSAVWQRD